MTTATATAEPQLEELTDEELDRVFELAARPENRERLAHLMTSFLGDEHFDLWQKHGFHLTRNNYISPIPDTRELGAEFWDSSSEMPGVDLNEDYQLHLLRDVFPRFADEYNQFPLLPSPDDPHQFFFQNDRFSGTDALALYCFVRHFQPRTILEVGSGFSTRVSAQATLKNGKGEVVCIEPYPLDEIRQGFAGLDSLIEERVEQVPIDRFLALSEDDILFIDSSHVAKIGSDVNYLFLEVLPRLAPGVIVHVHDIYLPHEYPQSWVKDFHWFWNEQYLLQAFLQFNQGFEVLFANAHLGAKHEDALKETFPNSPWYQGGSFWMRRRKVENG